MSLISLFWIKIPKSEEDYDLRVPRDMAYIFSGAYIPLSCKIIEQVSPVTPTNGNLFTRVKHNFPIFFGFYPGVRAGRLDGAGRSNQADQRS